MGEVRRGEEGGVLTPPTRKDLRTKLHASLAPDTGGRRLETKDYSLKLCGDVLHIVAPEISDPCRFDHTCAWLGHCSASESILMSSTVPTNANEEYD